MIDTPQRKLRRFSTSTTKEQILYYKNHPGVPLGLSTGWRSLDRLTWGIASDEMWLVAGRPGMGKTSFLLNVSLNIAKRGCRIAFFEQEMSEEQLLWRLASIESGIPMDAIKLGYRYIGGQQVSLSDREYEIFFQVLDYVASLPIAIAIGSISTDEMRYCCEQVPGLALVVSDHIGLHSDGGRSSSSYQRVSAVTRALIDIKLDFKVPILAAAQLNREVEKREKKIPQLSDLRDSGASEQDFENVLFPFRADYYDNEEVPEAQDTVSDLQVHLAKGRNCGVGYAHLDFHLATQRIYEPSPVKAVL